MPLGFLLETLSDPLEIGLFKSSTRRKCQIPLLCHPGARAVQSWAARYLKSFKIHTSVKGLQANQDTK
jgi:hypothetical protein